MAEHLLTPAMLALIAGSSIFLGAVLASKEHIQPKWLENELHHTITAVGGGALAAAVALVLIPEGMAYQSLWTSIPTFLLGGFFALWLDYFFAKRKSTASQLTAMLMDYIPETIVIGAIFTEKFSKAILLTVIIFIQNLPESFCAFREIKRSQKTKNIHLLFAFLAVAVSGPLFVYIGMFFLAKSEAALGMLMTFCAGSILYLMFNDIAPQAHLRNRFLPPIGALIGFLVGMVGYQLT